MDIETLGLVRVEDPRAKQALHDALRRAWSMPLGQAYVYDPSPNPVPIRRRQLGLLTPDAYRVSEKPDGVRYNLLLARLDERPVAALMNRKCELFQVHVAADDAYFDGTVIVGELVRNFRRAEDAPFVSATFGAQPVRDTFTCWFYDIYGLEGRPVLELGFFDRQDLLAHCFLGLLDPATRIVSREPSLEFDVKAFLPLEHAANIHAAIPVRPHPVDGLILMPIHEPVVSGTQWTQFKFKTQHTVDLRLSLAPGDVHAGTGARMDLACMLSDGSQGLSLVRDGIAMDEAAYRLAQQPRDPRIGLAGGPHAPRPEQPAVDPRMRVYVSLKPNAAWHIIQREFAASAEPSLVCIVECLLHPGLTADPADPRRVRIEASVLRLRVDKSVPNVAWTVQQTICNLFEDISLAELVGQGHGYGHGHAPARAS